MRELLPLAALGLLAACAGSFADPTGQPGGQQAIMSYYDAHATEEHVTCVLPRMTAITRSTVVQDTPENLVLAIRYTYQPLSRGGGTTVDGKGHGSRLTGCDGFATRQFTLTRTSGGAAVQSMTGEQRGGLAAQG
jgi:hypothetical protein